MLSHADMVDWVLKNNCLKYHSHLTTSSVYPFNLLWFIFADSSCHLFLNSKLIHGTQRKLIYLGSTWGTCCSQAWARTGAGIAGISNVGSLSSAGAGAGGVGAGWCTGTGGTRPFTGALSGGTCAVAEVMASPGAMGCCGSGWYGVAGGCGRQFLSRAGPPLISRINALRVSSCWLRRSALFLMALIRNSSTGGAGGATVI